VHTVAKSPSKSPSPVASESNPLSAMQLIEIGAPAREREKRAEGLGDFSGPAPASALHQWRYVGMCWGQYRYP
jgi:hypothetical protein